ncbi:MAG: squalene--hopene cyclase [Litorimonas sp.]
MNSKAMELAHKTPEISGLEDFLKSSAGGLKNRQNKDGHWLFELEADATIPAEYIFFMHYMDEIDLELQKKLCIYLRRIQNEDGSWPLFYQGDMDISATVKGYYALKLAGEDIDAPHMIKAREMILAAGGAERTNVFTRYALALFGQVPWKAVPVMPVELMSMPDWFPVTIWKISYWSRTVIAPLLVVAALKPQARNPNNIHIPELFKDDPETIKDYHKNVTGKWLGDFFIGLDKILRVVEPYFPKKFRKKSIDKTVEFFTERMNGEDGLGAIFPAMANAIMALDALGYDKNDPIVLTGKAALKKLLTDDNGEIYCQPCLSPVWDTALASHAMLEAGNESNIAAAEQGCDWLIERQILEVKGDYIKKAPDLRPGGWAFQYWNDHYPDVDDTAVVGMAMHRTGDPKYKEPIARAEEWILGMQSSNGGWGAFDIDNDKDYLNYVPFADHGALLDPPTEDVTARCLSFLGQIGHDNSHPVVAKGLKYLRETQEDDGSWYGRWGTNYIYGTWSVLCALNILGEPHDAPYIRKAVDWMLSRQNTDGGWGEDGATYYNDRKAENKASTPSQTSWAVLGLMAVGEVDNPAVRRGIEFIMSAKNEDGKWEEPWFTAVGFPRIFYLRYHGYSSYFPIWAMARYQNLKNSNSKTPAFGM